MKSVYFDQPLTEIIVVDCIPVYELFDWLILNANIPFIKNMDAFIAGKGFLKHLKYIGIRNSSKCAIFAIRYNNKEILAYLKSVYHVNFNSTVWVDNVHFLASRL